MISLFKKKKQSEQAIQLYRTTIKNKYNVDLYVGEFITIKKENGFYAWYAYGEKLLRIINNVSNSEVSDYCNELGTFGIVEKIDRDNVDVLVIKTDGYLQFYKIETTKNLKNGTQFTKIEKGNLYIENECVGKIIDDRYCWYNKENKLFLAIINNGRLGYFSSNITN